MEHRTSAVSYSTFYSNNNNTRRNNLYKMDAMQTTTFVDTTPPMSRTKQARIDIWRNEVALLTTTPDVPGRPGSPSSTDSPASLSSSPSRSSSSIVSRPRDEESRARRLFRRISGKITGKSRGRNPEEDVIRTRMYKDEQAAAAATQAEDDALAAVERESEEHPRGGLKEKQERLERAARLLEQGPSQDV